jgi:hypothetical protein
MNQKRDVCCLLWDLLWSFATKPHSRFDVLVSVRDDDVSGHSVELVYKAYGRSIRNQIFKSYWGLDRYYRGIGR